MKRFLGVLLSVVVLSLCLAACEKKAPIEKDLPVLDSSITELKSSQTVEDFQFTTKYDTGDYKLNRWRITDSKIVNMSATVTNVPKGATVLIEHVHIDMSLKSTNTQVDGLTQDSMDDSYHGTSQDGFLISDKYSYHNVFAIEGFSKDLISGWGFCSGSYGSSSLSEKRLTEDNLTGAGKVYANKMQVVYDLLIKYDKEQYFHTVSVIDEFLIKVNKPVDTDN